MVDPYRWTQKRFQQQQWALPPMQHRPGPAPCAAPPPPGAYAALPAVGPGACGPQHYQAAGHAAPCTFGALLCYQGHDYAIKGGLLASTLGGLLGKQQARQKGCPRVG
jgi:hypothetical protein